MHAVFRRALTLATLPILASSGLLLLPGAALAEETTAADTADDTTEADATAASTCVARGDLTSAMLSHTFDPATGAGTVTYGGDDPLCEPFVVRATTWRFQDGESAWPQDLIGFNDTTFTEPGTYPYATPTRDCGQLDIYAGWSANVDVQGGNGLAVPDVITGPNAPYEPRFLHEFSTGPDPTYDVSATTCVPAGEEPDDGDEDTEPVDGDEEAPDTDDEECVDAVDDPDCETVLPTTPIDQEAPPTDGGTLTDGDTTDVPTDGDTPTIDATPVDTDPSPTTATVTDDDVTADALPNTGVSVTGAAAGAVIAMALGVWLLRLRPATARDRTVG